MCRLRGRHSSPQRLAVQCTAKVANPGRIHDRPALSVAFLGRKKSPDRSMRNEDRTELADIEVQELPAEANADGGAALASLPASIRQPGPIFVRLRLVVPVLPYELHEAHRREVQQAPGRQIDLVQPPTFIVGLGLRVRDRGIDVVHLKAADQELIAGHIHVDLRLQGRPFREQPIDREPLVAEAVRLMIVLATETQGVRGLRRIAGHISQKRHFDIAVTGGLHVDAALEQGRDMIDEGARIVRLGPAMQTVDTRQRDMLRVEDHPTADMHVQRAPALELHAQAIVLDLHEELAIMKDLVHELRQDVIDVERGDPLHFR